MISILCPSRGRPEQFKRMVMSAAETAEGEYGIIGYFDDDDESHYPMRIGMSGPPLPLGPAYAEAFKSATGDIIMMAADDLVFRTKGWDTKVKEAMPKDLIGVVSFDDQGKLARKASREHGHPFIGRKLIELMGYICHPKLNHSCVDNWVVDIAKAVNRFYYLEDVLIEHVHPKYGKGELDETYRANTKEIKEKDGRFYKHDGQSELKATIKRVSKYLND